MIDRGHRLSLKRQAALLRLSRGSLYYEPRPVCAADLAIMGSSASSNYRLVM